MKGSVAFGNSRTHSVCNKNCLG